MLVCHFAAFQDLHSRRHQTYYQWTRMRNLPGWWVKKVWRSYDGWLLVAKKEEFNLLIPDNPAPLDQRNLVEETLSSESSMEDQRQNMGADMARQALQNFLHLPDGSLPTRERSRSPRVMLPLVLLLLHCPWLELLKFLMQMMKK